jgi:hypothetical protein
MKGVGVAVIVDDDEVVVVVDAVVVGVGVPPLPVDGRRMSISDFIR